MDLCGGSSCLGKLTLQPCSVSQNFRAELGLEATCIEDLRNHPQTRQSSRLRLLTHRSHSIPRPESLQGRDCSSLGSQTCDCIRLLRKHAHRPAPSATVQLSRDSGNGYLWQKEHRFIVKNLKHIGRIMSKKWGSQF